MNLCNICHEFLFTDSVVFAQCNGRKNDGHTVCVNVWLDFNVPIELSSVELAL